jgi:Flp pilus assembly protein CpaB
MVMTRSTNGVTTDPVGAPPPPRVVARPPGLPGARAVLGGVLIMVAVVATFASWQRSSGTPHHTYAVATTGLDPGDPVTAEAVRFVAIDLPAGVARAAFSDAADLEGRVTLAPIGSGELLQRASLSDQRAGPAAAEVSLALDRALAVDGHLTSGDRVDVYGTTDGATEPVAQGLRIVTVSAGGGSFDEGDQLTVTLAVPEPSQRLAVIGAARGGVVTLVRTTHADPSGATGAAPPGADPPGDPPPVADEPAADEPAADEPAGDEPTGDSEPAGDEPTGDSAAAGDEPALPPEPGSGT